MARPSNAKRTSKKKRSGMVIVVGHPTGGCGASTIALALGTLLQGMKDDPQLMDLDDTNKTLWSSLSSRMNLHPEVLKKPLRQLECYVYKSVGAIERSVARFKSAEETVVIDAGPQTRPMTVRLMALADVVVLPVRQGSMWLEALRSIEGHLTQASILRVRKGLPRPQVYTLMIDFVDERRPRLEMQALQSLPFGLCLGSVPRWKEAPTAIEKGLAPWEVAPDHLTAKTLNEMLRKIIRSARAQSKRAA